MLDAGRKAAARRRASTDAATLAVEVARRDAADWAEQVGRIRASRTSWLVAHGAAGRPADGVRPPEAPGQHVIVATDGSQVAPDRHDGAAGCYLLNVGRVFLSYGTGRRPRLDSAAEVVALDDEDEETERAAAAGLALRRFGREMAELRALIAEAADTGLPALALTDGSLIAWNLEDESGENAAKQEAFAALMETLESARAADVPVAGYVSGPGSRDVVNALRVALCPEQPVDCRRCPHPADALPCAPVRLATDAALFARLLGPGERSPVFTAQGQATGFSRILPLYGPRHWIAFFYLNVGPEIARVEFPAWVAQETTLVDRVHALCLDQASKGHGYPVALAEAHEQAVVRGADREAFLALLRRALIRDGAAPAASRKALAKRTRAV